MAKKYYLAPGVKVRDEDFGLLFYLCRTTDLVFINSGRLVPANGLKRGGTVKEVLGEKAAKDGYEQQAEKLFGKLVGKGLLEVRESK